MKKVLSIILTLVLVLSMSVTAFAAESGDIKVTYSQPNPEKVTIVDLTWGSMEFNYNSGDKKVWNPEKLEYEIVEGEEGDASWTPANEGGDTVTVTNHSNTEITATPSYTAKDGFESAGMNFSTDALKVATADNGVDGAAGTAVTGTITVTPTGSLPEGTENATIGSITITIS